MKVSWGRAFGGSLIAQAGQIAASIGWVAVYSYLINPGQSFATYQAHAQVSGPWVSIVAGAPIFYAASRWIARSQATALALFGILLVVLPGPGALALIWLIGAYAIVFGVLMLVLAFRLRGLRETMRHASGAA